ncbi:MAG: hypothetical protein KDD55_02760 [Bdellovibrionales bacterium]|nr:hypothetical protein [Bdellovibrionales bacterium]
MFNNRPQLSLAKIFSLLCSLLIPFSALATDLLSPSPVTPRNQGTLQAWEASKEYVVVNRSALTDSNSFTVSLGGQVSTAHTAPQARNSTGTTNSKSGYLTNENGTHVGSYTLSTHGNSGIYGVFQRGNETYELKSEVSGLTSLTLKNHDALPPCPEGDAHHDDFDVQHQEPQATPIQRTDTITIDVLVAYTPSALAAAGSTDAMLAQIDTAISLANTAYENSGIDLQLRLVHAYETEQDESDSFSTDLSDFASDGDGRFDEVHSLRNQYGADMSVLARGPGEYCGIGFRPYNSTLLALDTLAFSVVGINCFTYHSLAHELGHNLGAHHNVENAGGTPLYEDGYGEHWTSLAEEDAGTLYRSVMAYAPGTRVAHFSNPNILHQGAPTGIEKQSNNASLLAASAPIVANYRDSVVSLTPSPSQGGEGNSGEPGGSEGGSGESGSSEVTYDLNLESSGNARNTTLTTIITSSEGVITTGNITIVGNKLNRRDEVKKTVDICSVDPDETGTSMCSFNSRRLFRRGRWNLTATWISEDGNNEIVSNELTTRLRKRGRKRSSR